MIRTEVLRYEVDVCVVGGSIDLAHNFEVLKYSWGIFYVDAYFIEYMSHLFTPTL